MAVKKYERTRFYKVVETPVVSGTINNLAGGFVNLKERGLDGNCEGTTDKHQWLLFPDWSTGVKEGGKDYIMCLNCLEHGHL